MTSTAAPTSTPRVPLADGLSTLCLDGLDAAVLVADASLKVVYGNPSAQRVLRGVAAEIERAFGTPLSEVVGVPLHHLFGDVGRVAAPDQLPHVSTITVGQAILRVQISSLRSTRGELLGYSAQFADVTTETHREGARRAQIAEADSRERRQLEDLSSKTQGVLDAVQAAMAGDLTHAIEVRGDDALGHIAANLAGFFSNLRANVGSIGAVAQALGTAADALDGTSRHMGDSAGSTATQAVAAASAADAVSSNINTVAAGTEELGASIREIARSAADAMRIASVAVNAAEETTTSIHKLGASSAEIGNVVKVITSIAQQTNLLALNATIEAARAGDAGRGFAVVANEVKELAKETAKATDDIGRRIDAIQTGTKGAVEAINRISEVIHQVNAIQTSIATAVEEQSATTNEISRSIAQAAAGAASISTSISEVALSAADTSRGATNVRGAAADLTRLAVDLRDLIAGFTV